MVVDVVSFSNLHFKSEPLCGGPFFKQHLTAAVSGGGPGGSHGARREGVGGGAGAAGRPATSCLLEQKLGSKYGASTLFLTS